MNGTSRNRFAVGVGQHESRLRKLEDRGILPEWKAVTEETYSEVVEAWNALRAARWSNQRVGKVFELIRSNNFEAGRSRAWRARVQYSIDMMTAIWPKLSQESRDEWQKLGVSHPSELDPDSPRAPWEE